MLVRNRKQRSVDLGRLRVFRVSRESLDRSDPNLSARSHVRMMVTTRDGSTGHRRLVASNRIDRMDGRVARGVGRRHDVVLDRTGVARGTTQQRWRSNTRRRTVGPTWNDLRADGRPGVVGARTRCENKTRAGVGVGVGECSAVAGAEGCGSAVVRSTSQITEDSQTRTLDQRDEIRTFPPTRRPDWRRGRWRRTRSSRETKECSSSMLVSSRQTQSILHSRTILTHHYSERV